MKSYSFAKTIVLPVMLKKRILAALLGVVIAPTYAKEASIALPQPEAEVINISPAPEKNSDQKTFMQKHQGKVIAAVLATSAIFGGVGALWVLNSWYQSKKWLDVNFLKTLSQDDKDSWDIALTRAMKVSKNGTSTLVHPLLYGELKRAVGLGSGLDGSDNIYGSNAVSLFNDYKGDLKKQIANGDGLSFTMNGLWEVTLHGDFFVTIASSDNGSWYIKDPESDLWRFWVYGYWS